jgi:hypothetical protein
MREAQQLGRLYRCGDKTQLPLRMTLRLLAAGQPQVAALYRGWMSSMDAWGNVSERSVKGLLDLVRTGGCGYITAAVSVGTGGSSGSLFGVLILGCLLLVELSMQCDVTVCVLLGALVSGQPQVVALYHGWMGSMYGSVGQRV